MVRDRKYIEGLLRFAAEEKAKWNELDEQFGDLEAMPDETVVRFRKQFDSSEVKYSYAAIKINDRWYLTQHSNGRMGPLSHDAFLKFLEGCTEYKVLKD